MNEPHNGYKLATFEDVRALNAYQQKRGRWGSVSYVANRAALRARPSANPWGLDDGNLSAAVGAPKHLEVIGCHAVANPDRFRQGGYNYGYGYHSWHSLTKPEDHKVDDKRLVAEPFFLLLAGLDQWGNQNWQANRKRFTPSAKMILNAKTVTQIDFNAPDGVERNYNNGVFDVANIIAMMEINGVQTVVAMPFVVAECALGLTVTEDLKLTLPNGVSCDFGCVRFLKNMNAYRSGSHSWRSGAITQFDFTFDTVNPLIHHIGMGRDNLNRMLIGIHKNGWPIPEVQGNGVKKVMATVDPIAREVANEDPIAYCAYRSFLAATNRSVEGVKLSGIFNECFKDVTTKEQFIKVLSGFYGDKPPFEDEDAHTAYYRSYNQHANLENAVKKLDVYKDKRRSVIKSQGQRAITKLIEEAESLTIDKKKHKLTWAAIESGKLSTGTFFRKSEQYFLLNDNWDLWEEMFKRGFGDQAIELANEVKGRTTYEKDLMSYFYFVLYALPEYLKKHTGCKWKCIPKIVNSADELEPPKEEGGVARKRSALTPIVDNEAKTVTVPYASLAIGGSFGTTYCYSHDYHVLTRGFSFNGYAVTKDIEEKLNGRDDYGLMFYTLTGSVQGRGYPTFLIIFERRERFEDTRVHFHRTHPSRSKSGDYNPIHNWIKVTYNWMAGNIRRDRIKAQQGDLFFVQVKTDANEDLDGVTVKDLDFSFNVDQYDSHRFETPVPFAEYTKKAKNNILGYVRLENDTMLRHTEHDDVKIPAGTYAIHQCRSWEANPKGVWSLRID